MITEQNASITVKENKMLQTLAQYTVNYNFNGVGSSKPASAATFFLIFIPAFVLAVIAIAGMWKAFQKAGKPGWASIVPVYNLYVMFEIAGKPGWWAFSVFLGIIPVIGWIVPFVLEIIAALEIAKRFGKSSTFGVVGLVLFSFVGWPILGFGDAKYQAPDSKPAEPQNPVSSAPSSPIQ